MQKDKKVTKFVLCILLAVAITVAYAPVNCDTVSAASFSKSSSVKGLKASCGVTSVTLSWKSVKGASGYEVYKRTKKESSYSRVKTTQKTKWKRTGLTTGKTCYYKVRPYKKSNGDKVYGKFCYAIKATPTLAAPNLSTKPEAISVKLTWNKVSGASGYNVYRSTKKNGTFKFTKATTGTTITRTNLTPGREYYYKVRAYKKVNGKKVLGKNSAVATGKPVLGVPKITTKSNSNSVTISWQKIAGAAGYQVYRASEGSSSYSKIGSTTGTSYENRNLETKKNFSYKVRAYSKSGDSIFYGNFSSISSCAAGTTSDSESGSSGSSTDGSSSNPGSSVSGSGDSGSTTADKSKPGNVTGTSVKGSSGYVTVSWSKVSGATGYDVYRSVSANKGYTKQKSVTSTSYKDTSVTSGKTYFYKLRAYKTVNGATIYGDFTSNTYSRDVIVGKAVEWLGCKESNGSHKKIIDVYNSDRGDGGKMTYNLAWCAAYVSAVGIKAGYQSIIYRHSYCPTMINWYKNRGYSSNKKYIPKPGDVVFYDWNKNNVPDHVGLIVSADSKTIKAIEGNKNDAVGYRTYSPGYGYLLGYGLPKYDSICGIKYNGSSSVAVTGLSTDEELSKVGIGSKPEGYSDIDSEYKDVEKKVFDGVGCGDKTTEYDKMLYMIKKVRSEANTKDIKCSESEYYAAFIYKLCQEGDIDASIVTKVTEGGSNEAYVEVSLDGKMYTVDASKKNAKPVKYTPEKTDCDI